MGGGTRNWSLLPFAKFTVPCVGGLLPFRKCKRWPGMTRNGPWNNCVRRFIYPAPTDVLPTMTLVEAELEWLGGCRNGYHVV